MLNNLFITHFSKELKDYYTNLFDTYAFKYNNDQQFFDNLKKLAWIRISSNVDLPKAKNDKNSLKLLKETGINNLDILKKYTIITNGIINNSGEINNIDKMGGFDNIYNHDDTYSIKYAPRPYIESLDISSFGEKLSLFKCTLNIVCHTKEELNIIELLYSNPRISNFLEFGYNTNNAMKEMLDLNNSNDNLNHEKELIFKDVERIKDKVEKSKGEYLILLLRPTKYSFKYDGTKYVVTIELLSPGVNDLFSNSNADNNFFTGFSNKPVKTSTKNTQQLDEDDLIDFIENAIGYMKPNYVSLVKIFEFFNYFINEYYNMEINLNRPIRILNTQFTETKNSENIMPLKYGSRTYLADLLYGIDNKAKNLIDKDNKYLDLRNCFINWRKWIKTKHPQNNVKTWLDVINSLISFIQENIFGIMNIKAILSNSFTSNKKQLINIVNKFTYDFNKEDKNKSNQKPLLIPVAGKKSVVSSLDISGELSNDIQGLIMYSKNTEINNSIGKFWIGLDDKFLKYKHAEESEQENSKKTKLNDKIIANIIHKYNNINSEKFTSAEISFIEKVLHRSLYNTKGTSPNTALEILFPLKINIDLIFGLSAAMYGKLFTINNIIPDKYLKNGCFFITSINHNISETNWTTSLEGSYMPLANSQ